MEVMWQGGAQPPKPYRWNVCTGLPKRLSVHIHMHCDARECRVWLHFVLMKASLWVGNEVRAKSLLRSDELEQYQACDGAATTSSSLICPTPPRINTIHMHRQSSYAKQRRVSKSASFRPFTQCNATLNVTNIISLPTRFAFSQPHLLCCSSL